MTDRAVSDVVGFVLVASLVTLTIGVVYVGGMGALEDARQAEQANNAERAFEVFAANVEDLVRGGAPSRSTEIQLGGARIGFAERVRFNVSLETGESFSAVVRPLVYDVGETRILYVNGAIVRAQEEGATMLRPPGFTVGNRTVVPYVVTRPVDEAGVAGSRRVLVRASVARRTVVAYTDPPDGRYDVTVNVTSNHPAVWADYLRRKGLDCERLGSTVSCSFRSSRVYVQVVRVDLDVK